MTKLEEQNNTLFAIAQATFIFLLLASMLGALVLFYDFSSINLGALAFILALASSVLISKNVYDLARESEAGKQRVDKLQNNINAVSSHKLLSEVYQNSPVAYLIIDSEGVVVSANISATRLLGRSQVRLIKSSFFSSLNSDKTDHLILLKEKFRNGVAISDEEIVIKHPTSMVWTLLSIFQFKDENGNKLSLVTLLDITKQKEVDTAKSEFVSLASHQLRTPLAGMRWSAELLMMDGAELLNKQQQRYISRLLANIRRMSDLIDDFLQVSRFDLGTRIIQPEVVNVPKLVEDIYNEQMIAVKNKKLNIVKDFDKNIIELVTDGNLLRMIITNLYSNAIRYSKDGGEVGITYRREGDSLIFDIKDSGIGIPVSEQAKIFSKIFRASNAIKEVPDGTGLGLYIVKKAVQVLRGRVSFVSTEDVGTTFTVVIPISI